MLFYSTEDQLFDTLIPTSIKSKQDSRYVANLWTKHLKQHDSFHFNQNINLIKPQDSVVQQVIWKDLVFIAENNTLVNVMCL